MHPTSYTFDSPAMALVAVALTMTFCVAGAFALLAVAHLGHRQPQDHCVWCRRDGGRR